MSNADLDVISEVETDSTIDEVLGTENQTQKEKDSEFTQQAMSNGLKSLKKISTISKKRPNFVNLKK